jgi:hypothetical protein
VLKDPLVCPHCPFKSRIRPKYQRHLGEKHGIGKFAKKKHVCSFCSGGHVESLDLSATQSRRKRGKRSLDSVKLNVNE